MLPIDCDFVILMLGKHDYLKRPVSLDQTLAITFFHSPSTSGERISDDAFLVESNAEVEHDVLVHVQSWRAHKVDSASEIRA